MTQGWPDLANSTFHLVWGANPVENHPASVAHIHKARFPKQYHASTDARYNRPASKLVVIDPRKSRTALMADMYVRIRPGTDIAFQNALLNYMITKIENGGAGEAIRTKYWRYMDYGGVSGSVLDEAVTLTGTTPSSLTNQAPLASVVVKDAPGGTAIAAAEYVVNAVTGTIRRSDTSTLATPVTVYVSYAHGYKGNFFTDGDAARPSTNTVAVPRSSKYTDARFVVLPDGGDYVREKVLAATGLPVAGGELADTVISDFPKKLSSADAPNTVLGRLKAHVAPYTLAVAADICGCQGSDIATVGDLMIEHSRFASYEAIGEIPDPANAGYRATCIMYAMGITQHTYGANQIKGFANIQSILGNMGRAGGGINALRGIHNVQGSTDMGLLYGNIPGYSSNPSAQYAAGPETFTGGGALLTSPNAFGKYMDALWGTPLSGTTVVNAGPPVVTTNRALMDGSYDDAYTPTAMALQQRGFYNMTLKWFGDYAGLSAGGTANRAKIDACYSIWPKGNGHNHVKMFREMGLGNTKAAVIWGQNPAVTEPNQGKVRAGLRNLDLMVVTELFETETVACDRKDGALTYVFPSAAHVEKAGSVTNSGRVLQWRYEAKKPAGNSRDDNELLLRFAKALDSAKAFAHIAKVWEDNAIFGYSGTTLVQPGDVYAKLYKAPYGGFDGLGLTAATSFNKVAGTAEIVPTRKLKSDTLPTSFANVAVEGSEWVAESVFREYAGFLSNGGTLWLYTEGYNHAADISADGGRLTNNGGWSGYGTWTVHNRAKSRETLDAGALGFHKWGYCWLVNRRVFYNNGEVLGDQNDFFMGPDSCVRLLAPKAMPATTLRGLGMPVFNYSRWYRTHAAPTPHVLADKPVQSDGSRPTWYANDTAWGVAGRFPGHTEPYESPRSADLGVTFGYNSSTSATPPGSVQPLNLVFNDTVIGNVAQYPLVLTTIRCVEHFQGGPITRNNTWNVDLEPDPWIEIHPDNAFYKDLTPIKTGDWVKVVTARNDVVHNASFAGSKVGADPNFSRALTGLGFRARVGVGINSNQRVGSGVVAIPWHWGDRGFATGSRANDLCIDAMDVNSTIPEYKACLCRLEKM